MSKSMDTGKHKFVWRNYAFHYNIAACVKRREKAERKDEASNVILKKSRIYSIGNWGAIKGVQPGELVPINTVLSKTNLSAAYRVKERKEETEGSPRCT